jgi:hypothetical protein
MSIYRVLEIETQKVEIPVSESLDSMPLRGTERSKDSNKFCLK